MKVGLKTLLLASLLLCAPAFAAGIDGDWSGSLDTPNGPVQVNYTFKTDGTVLTGSSTGPDGTKLPIKDGKVEGNNISFTLDVDFGGNSMTFKYAGVVGADGIALSTDFQGEPMKFTIKKTSK